MVLHLWGLPLSDDKFEDNIMAFEKSFSVDSLKNYLLPGEERLILHAYLIS
jgi:hypothetical protein